MSTDNKKHLRAIVRRVHPDLFTAHPIERQRNSESLKLLNNYLDDVSRGVIPDHVSLEFWVKNGEGLTPICAELRESCSLAPLFAAFGLISEDEEQEMASATPSSDEDLLNWLRATVQEAVATADQHYLLKQRINDLRAMLEEMYSLDSIMLGNEFGASKVEQQQQLESLRILGQGLEEICSKSNPFEGLSLCVHHPSTYPLDPLKYGGFGGTIKYVPRTCRIADDGRIHVVADSDTICNALSTVDIDWARLLTRLSAFWVKRGREMASSLKEALRVEDVLCDTTIADNAQKFVLWAGCLMEHREEIESLVSNREHSFSVLLHSDTAAPMIDYLDSTSILQVRSDCPPRTMIDFLASDTCLKASREAKQVLSTDDEEEKVLEKARQALGAKHVIRVCSSNERERVIAAARRLIKHAEAIRRRVDLSGASIAIDNCYQLWEAGFLSIPHDFQLQELQPRLQKMLGSGDGGPQLGHDEDATPESTSVNDTITADGLDSSASRSNDDGEEMVSTSDGKLPLGTNNKVQLDARQRGRVRTRRRKFKLPWAMAPVHHRQGVRRPRPIGHMTPIGIQPTSRFLGL